MGLRRREEWEKPTSAAQQLADLRSFHELVRLGAKGFACKCGNVFSGADYRDARIRHAMHLRACLESIEQSNKGVDRYDDE